MVSVYRDFNGWPTYTPKDFVFNKFLSSKRFQIQDFFDLFTTKESDKYSFSPQPHLATSEKEVSLILSLFKCVLYILIKWLHSNCHNLLMIL